MVQQVTTLVAKPADLSLIPGSFPEEGQECDSVVELVPWHMNVPKPHQK